MNFLVFDTETQKGKAFIACTSDGKEEKDFFINSKLDAIKFFAWLHTNCKTGFCFNLKYDMSALIKYFGQEAILGFYVEKPITFECEGSKYEISGVIGKFVFISKLVMKKNLGIEKLSHQTTTFYDINQYFGYEKLHKVATRYLGEGKDEIPEEWKKNMLKYFNNPLYKEKIIKYCRKDANLTHRLSSLFLQMLIDTGVIKEEKINKSRYYSSGYIAKKFIGKNAKIMPLYDDKINAHMKSFCFGGRIEVFKRGYFPNVYLNDINSAYGSGLYNLKYITGYNFSTRPSEGAEYFFADCEFYVPENYVQPVPIHFKNWKYPYGHGRALLDKRTLENVQRTGNILKIHSCLNIFTDEHYPFRKIIKTLYSQRIKSPAHKLIFKNLINSYIGKLNEKVRIRTWVEDEAEQEKLMVMLGNWRSVEREFESDIQHCGCGCYELKNIDPYCKCKVCINFRSKNKKFSEPPSLYWLGDKMFHTKEVLKYKTHSIYNALVVSGMRNSMYEEGLKFGDDLIGIYTDAIFSTKKMEKTDENKLGAFSEKYKGWLYLIGSGTYETAPDIITNKDGSTEEISTTKLRGYNANINLVAYANKFKQEEIMEIPALETVGMAQVVGGLKSFNEFNELKEKKKYLNVNFDANRMWERQFKNYDESLKCNINSHPIKL